MPVSSSVTVVVVVEVLGSVEARVDCIGKKADGEVFKQKSIPTAGVPGSGKGVSARPLQHDLLNRSPRTT